MDKRVFGWKARASSMPAYIRRRERRADESGLRTASVDNLATKNLLDCADSLVGLLTSQGEMGGEEAELFLNHLLETMEGGDIEYAVFLSRQGGYNIIDALHLIKTQGREAVEESIRAGKIEGNYHLQSNLQPPETPPILLVASTIVPPGHEVATRSYRTGRHHAHKNRPNGLPTLSEYICYLTRDEEKTG